MAAGKTGPAGGLYSLHMLFTNTGMGSIATQRAQQPDEASGWQAVTAIALQLIYVP